jgi:nitroreductase
MVVIAVSKNLQHPKVPVWEQQLATAAAVQNMINAAFIIGVGAYWRTGSATFSDIVKQALDITREESIVGFVYLGTPKSELPAAKSTDNWQSSVKFGV